MGQRVENDFRSVDVPAIGMSSRQLLLMSLKRECSRAKKPLGDRQPKPISAMIKGTITQLPRGVKECKGALSTLSLAGSRPWGLDISTGAIVVEPTREAEQSIGGCFSITDPEIIDPFFS